MEGEFNQPIVIDNGTGILKAGFAGGDQPKCVFPSYVGRPKHTRVMASNVEGEYLIGSKAEEHRGLLKVEYPMEHGIVTRWEDMERIWRHTFKQLGVQSEDHPVLLTEAPLNPLRNREKATEIFFETFSSPALLFSLQAVLSLYASGRTTGVILDSGDGVTHVVPIYEGFAIPNSIVRIDLAGRDVTTRLQLLLRRAGYHFNTSAEREVVRQIKESMCYVAFDPSKEEELVFSEGSRIGSPAQAQYTLPDGTLLNLGPERFRAPEILFQPDIVGEEYPGIHE